MSNLIVFVLFLHWLGDFVCQTRWMADNKSKNMTALMIHCAVYTCVLSLGLWFVIRTPGLMLFLILNCGAHLLTDSITSRMTTYCYEKQWMHTFFLVIGFDQLVHSACLVWTTALLLHL